ncbi:CHAP domain-containing protein [Alloscardovia macacae]|uniref:CHAP domain-containing protein n=1 Tax=Alloscardovia macacae TaxID=1160091 RepID=A0A1Y2T191_9BIFI|nr:CHAP domain-containing protein [Alloscardovia macacae]OTA29418.1 CHAP domain-containing protein [Alloscardovia macacae]
MKATRKNVRTRMNAVVAAGTVALSLISGSIVSWYISPMDDANALTPYQTLAQHQQAQASLKQQLAGVNNELARLITDLNDLVNNQIPAAETAASQAQDAAASAAKRAQEAADRLTAAQNDKTTLEQQLTTAQATNDDAKDKVAALARRSFHGSDASKTMSVVTGSKSAEEYIQTMQSDSAVSRVEAKAASDSATELSTGKNRVDRLTAIEQRITGLKAQADQQSAAAQQASADANAKVSSLNDLRSQADQKSKQLSAQQANLQTAEAREAAAVVQAQVQVDEYNRQLAAQAAAQAAAARKKAATSQYTGKRQNTSSNTNSQPAPVNYNAQNAGDYSVPGNCGPTATSCYGHNTGRTAVLGGAYPWSQCTWYAYNRRTALGLPVGSYMGNGKDWANTGRRLGYVVNNTPHVGAAMVFQAGQAGSDRTYGHVAIVERVNADGSVLISECGAVYQGVAHSRIIRNASAYQYVHI